MGGKGGVLYPSRGLQSIHQLPKGKSRLIVPFYRLIRHQGLVLHLFINDLPLHLETDNVFFYADNTITHAADDSLKMVYYKLQNSVTKFDLWCVDHDMLINYIKTHLMILGSRHMTSAIEDISISLNGHTTEIVNMQKHTGVVIEKKK